MQYALQLIPHPNTRYMAAQQPLSLAELHVIAKGVGLSVSGARHAELGGLKLILFEAEPDERQMRALGRMSNFLALYEIHGELLRPAMPEAAYEYAYDMGAILKYKGKTNETFTRLLLNLAVFSAGAPFDGRLKILDPLCGKGTTLFCALAWGYDALGLDADKKAVHEAAKFAKGYLEYNKLKHIYQNGSLTVDGAAGGYRHSFETAPSQEAFKAGERQTLQLIAGDTLKLAVLAKNWTFDALAADLPYGVQHAARSQSPGALALLEEALPVWARKLRRGGAMALSFNSYTLRKDKLLAALANAGLSPLTGPPYDTLGHWVEQAVMRDIAVAVK